MRLSTTDIYVFKALGYLGTKQVGQYAGSEEVSTAAGVGRTYLVRILAALTAAGLVESKKGAGGGYRLPKPPSEISLRDVMRAVDGPIASLACVSLVWPKKCMHEGKCRARSHIWLKVRNAVLEVLGETSVADLAQDFVNGVDYSDCLEHLLNPSEMLSARMPG